MKTRCALLAVVVVFAFSACKPKSPSGEKTAPSAASVAGGQEKAPSAAGYWYGVLEANGTLLRLGFDVTQGPAGTLSVSLDSLDQGMRNMAADIDQQGRSLEIQVPVINGIFEADFSADGAELVGRWRQGAVSLPLTVKRMDKAAALKLPPPGPKLTPEQLAANQRAAQAAAGDWSGTLDVQGTRLRLIFHLTKNADGTCTATLDSPDQGATALPIGLVGFTEPTLQLDLKAINASFSGELKGDEIKGTWKQLAREYPLTLKRVAAKGGAAKP